jgi:putative lysine transport system substrate-binding protein
MTLTLALSLALTLTACGGKTDPTPTPDGENTTPVHTVAPVANLTGVDTSAIPGVEDGVLTVGMECAYAPYNWTQLDDSNGAVPIVNNPGSYANGYDVMIAQRLCEAYGWELEVMAIEWDGLNAALASGTVDMVIAGQSMTAVRMAQVDMAGPYFYASIVCVTKAGSEQAAATGISKLTGTCTAQTGTVWYDTCLPQISGAQMMPQAETAPAMVMAVESGTVDFICTDMPTAMAACATYPDLTILDFTGTEDNFQVSEEEINIGLSVRQGNSQLQECANTVLNDMSVEDFNALMNQAISVQPEL